MSEIISGIATVIGAGEQADAYKSAADTAAASQQAGIDKQIALENKALGLQAPFMAAAYQTLPYKTASYGLGTGLLAALLGQAGGTNLQGLKNYYQSQPDWSKYTITSDGQVVPIGTTSSAATTTPTTAASTRASYQFPGLGSYQDWIGDSYLNSITKPTTATPATTTPASTQGISNMYIPDISMSESPLYKWQLQEGMRNLNTSLAARGLSKSGAGLRAINDFTQSLGASETDKQYNRLAGIASALTGQDPSNMGATAATSAAGNLTSTGASVSGAYGNISNQQLAAGAGMGNVYGNMYRTLGGLGAGSLPSVSSLFSGGGTTGISASDSGYNLGGFDPYSMTGLQEGGLAEAGKPYVVGEQGPEVFTPQQDGLVIPNPRTQARQQGFDSPDLKDAYRELMWAEKLRQKLDTLDRMGLSPELIKEREQIDKAYLKAKERVKEMTDHKPIRAGLGG